MRLDTTLLIKEIEKRPAIWNLTISDYADKLVRKRCWEELTEIFSPEKISEKEKKSLNELIQKKWKNIRDRFARDTKYGVGKKSQYMYGPNLQFLRHSIRMRSDARSSKDILSRVRKSSEVLDSSEASEPATTDHSSVSLAPKNTSDNLEEPRPPADKRNRRSNNLEEPKPPSDKRNRRSNNLEEPKPPADKRNRPCNNLEEPKPPADERNRPDNSLVETKLIEFLERNITELQDTAKNSQDEDRLFLLSMLTNLKSIQPRFKLKAKIEMLSVLDKYPKIDEESDIAVLPQILEVMHS